MREKVNEFQDSLKANIITFFSYQGIFQDDLIFGNLVKNCFNKILGV